MFDGRINERILRNTWKILDESYQGQFGSGPGRDHGKPRRPRKRTGQRNKTRGRSVNKK